MDQKLKDLSKMTFEEVIKHISSHYIETPKNSKCTICQEIRRILSEFKFLSLKKSWDYDP